MITVTMSTSTNVKPAGDEVFRVVRRIVDPTSVSRPVLLR